MSPRRNVAPYGAKRILYAYAVALVTAAAALILWFAVFQRWRRYVCGDSFSCDSYYPVVFLAVLCLLIMIMSWVFKLGWRFGLIFCLTALLVVYLAIGTNHMPLMAILLAVPALAAFATWVWQPNNEPTRAGWMPTISSAIGLLEIVALLVMLYTL